MARDIGEFRLFSKFFSRCIFIILFFSPRLLFSGVMFLGKLNLCGFFIKKSTPFSFSVLLHRFFCLSIIKLLHLMSSLNVLKRPFLYNFYTIFIQFCYIFILFLHFSFSISEIPCQYPNVKPW